MAIQPSQLLLRILNLNHTRISVFPEVEEFLVMLDGFCGLAHFFVNFGDVVIDFGALIKEV